MDLRKLLKTNTKGFTFIEIVVVLGIFAVITSVVLFNFKDFSSGISLQNLSQQIALQVSSMQRSTLAGKQPFALTPVGVTPPAMSPDPDTGVWTPSYGLCFTVNPNDCSLSGSYGNTDAVTAFTTFADSKNDKFFNTANERMDIIKIDGGDVIYEVCVNQQTNSGSCVDSAIVIYERPDASPQIRYRSDWSQSAADLTVRIRSQEGLTREVIIWKSGQVEVN